MENENDKPLRGGKDPRKPSFAQNNGEKFRQKILRGQVCVGTAVTLSDPAVSELCGDAGYDFTWIDTEHAPLDNHTVLTHVMATRGTDVAPFVRVPANDPVLIKPLLELEPAAIIVPLIQSPQDVRKAVEACKYPPRGIRGYGPRRGVRFGGVDMQTYLDEADDHTMVIVQIEHIDAVNALDAILATEGLDGICLGPNDLSGSLGVLGQISHPDVAAAIDTTIEKARASGVLLGVATGYDPQRVRGWIAKGIQWICLDTDCVGLYRYATQVIDDVQSIPSAARSRSSGKEV